MPQQFDCVVYSGPSEFDDDGEDWLGEFYTPLVEVARTVALANSRREAAARAWVRTVGRARARQLRELGAPATVIQMDSDHERIANELVICELWVGECLKLVNGVESWFVAAIPARDGDSQLLMNKKRGGAEAMKIFTGFDSAWGGRQRGAICDMLANEREAGRVELQVIGPPVQVTWDDAVRRAEGESRIGERGLHVVAVDQGLVVPNATGMRYVERTLASALMAEFQCGAHSSNLTKRSCYGPNAGVWRFLAALRGKGYCHDPMAIPNRQHGRFFFECYPHPALIGLFSLGSVLGYKARKRNAAAWKQLIGLLGSLASHESLPVSNIAEVIAPLSQQNKANEDKLDAVICAYVAAFFWFHGTSRCSMIGSLTSGYIVTPHNRRMLELFKGTFGDRMNGQWP